MTDNLLRCLCILVAMLMACIIALSAMIWVQHDAMAKRDEKQTEMVNALIGELGYYSAALDRQNQTLTAWTNVVRSREKHEAGSRLRKDQEEAAGMVTESP